MRQRASLYLDEDFCDTALVKSLRKSGLLTLTAAEVGMLGRPDEEQLSFASERELTIVSYNIRDFQRLHTERVALGQHSGIILGAQQRYPVGEVVRRLLRLIDTISAAEMRNRLEFLSRWG